MVFVTYLRILIQLQAVGGQAYQQRINTFVQGNAALKAVGTEEVRLLTDFAPSLVVAHGAAVFAGAIEENPHHFVEPSGTSKYLEKQWFEFLAQL